MVPEVARVVSRLRDVKPEGGHGVESGRRFAGPGLNGLRGVEWGDGR